MPNPLLLASVNNGGITVSHWGGEEFMIFLRTDSLDTAQSKAETLRESIEQNLIVMNHGELISITISIGVAFYPFGGKKIDDLILKADEELYEAKNRGRNQVVTSAHLHQK